MTSILRDCLLLFGTIWLVSGVTIYHWFDHNLLYGLLLASGAIPCYLGAWSVHRSESATTPLVPPPTPKRRSITLPSAAIHHLADLRAKSAPNNKANP